MKKVIVITMIFSLGLIGVFIGGAVYGEWRQGARLGSLIEVDAEQQLALYIEVLNEMESGDPKKALWMLQSGSASRLDLIVDFSDFGANSRFKCALLNRYKKYYDDHRLFSTKAWASMMQVDGMQEAVRRRVLFLNKRLPLVCPGKGR